LNIDHQESVAPGGVPVNIRVTHTYSQDKPGRLLAVSAGEIDSSANNHPDQFIIYLVKDGGAGIPLLNDYSISGSSHWQGSIPLHQGYIILVSFINPPAGAICRVDSLIASKEEAEGCGIGGFPRSQATFPLGGLRVISLDGTAGTLTLALQPQAGFTWNILEAWGFHDDTSARSLNWSWYDGITTISKGGLGTACAAQVVTPLPVNGNATSNWLCSPLSCHRGVYPILNADALTAGKKLYVRAVVAEYGGLQ